LQNLGFLPSMSRLTVRPAMNAQDLANARSGIESAVKTHGKSSA
jgi:hypothetical protein